MPPKRPQPPPGKGGKQAPRKHAKGGAFEARVVINVTARGPALQIKVRPRLSSHTRSPPLLTLPLARRGRRPR